MLRLLAVLICAAGTASAQDYKVERDFDARPGANNPYVRQAPSGPPPGYTIRPIPEPRAWNDDDDKVYPSTVVPPTDFQSRNLPYKGGHGMGPGGPITPDRWANHTFYMGVCKMPRAFAPLARPATIVVTGGRKLRRVNNTYDAEEIYCTPY